jgi:hypothetical protein
MTSQNWGLTAGAAEIPSHEGLRAEASTDFGRLIHREPRAVAQPVSSAEVASLLRLARDERLTVAARGQGHSIYGRSLSEDGIVIDMNRLSTIRDVGPDRIMVDAGATWQSVLDATLPQGLTPPVLTNYLGLSVGGTIAVGGIGGSSSRYGMQTDNVLELNIVTGDGQVLACSAKSNPNAFDAIRAGLGQCGIITRAALRLVRAPERVRRFQLFYPGLSELIADQRRVLTEDRFDQLQGAILPDGAGGWRYQLEAAVFHDAHQPPDEKALLKALSDTRSAAVTTDLSYGEDAAAFAKFEALLRSKRQWTTPKPWLLTFLPGRNAEQLARDVLAELTPADIGPFGRITCYPMRTRACRTPLLRLPDEVPGCRREAYAVGNRARVSMVRALIVAALTPSYRLAVASRTFAAIIGGYALTALATFALAIFLPMSRAEASMTATLASFLIYSCVVIWVFATRTAWRAWAGILASMVVLGGLVWLQRQVAAS